MCLDDGAGPAIRTALLGAVRHGLDYGRLVQRLAGFELSSVVDGLDLAPEVREANSVAASLLGVPYCEMPVRSLSDAGADLFVVASEPRRHGQLALEAVARGLPVIVDKPICIDTAEAASLAKRARETRSLATYIHRLHSPAMQTAKRIIAEGRLGQLRTVHWVFLVSTDLPSTPTELRAAVEPGWAGGGEIANLVGYLVDAVRYLAGVNPLSVDAIANSVGSEPHLIAGCESMAAVHATFQQGVTALALIGRSTAPLPSPGIYEYRLIGSHGMAVVREDLEPIRTTVTAVGTDEGDYATSQAALESLFREAAQCLRDGGKPLRSLADGAQGVALLEAAYTAAREKRTVSVEEVEL